MTTYNNISFTSTTQTETFHGRGIMCDNTDIYCDSEEYYCDGSVVFRCISFDAGAMKALFGGAQATFGGEVAFWRLGSVTTYNKISY